MVRESVIWRISGARGVSCESLQRQCKRKRIRPCPWHLLYTLITISIEQVRIKTSQAAIDSTQISSLIPGHDGSSFCGYLDSFPTSPTTGQGSQLVRSRQSHARLWIRSTKYFNQDLRSLILTINRKWHLDHRRGFIARSSWRGSTSYCASLSSHTLTLI